MSYAQNFSAGWRTCLLGSESLKHAGKWGTWTNDTAHSHSIRASWIQPPSRSSALHPPGPTTGSETRLITHTDKIVLTFTQGWHRNVWAPHPSLTPPPSQAPHAVLLHLQPQHYFHAGWRSEWKKTQLSAVFWSDPTRPAVWPQTPSPPLTSHLWPWGDFSPCLDSLFKALLSDDSATAVCLFVFCSTIRNDSRNCFNWC